MPSGHRKLLKDDLNGDAAFDTASTAKEGMLQRLELSRRDTGCISWGLDFTTVRCTRLQDGLLQSDQQPYRVRTLQVAKGSGSEILLRVHGHCFMFIETSKASETNMPSMRMHGPHIAHILPFSKLLQKPIMVYTPEPHLPLMPPGILLHIASMATGVGPAPWQLEP